MSSSNLKIFSVFHKEYPVPVCDYIVPIQVGKEQSGIDLGFIADNTGDHIADKNSTYSELTALYWIWKNLDSFDCKWVGLSHYRRYFTMPETTVKKKLLQTKLITDERPVYEQELSQEQLEFIASDKVKNALLEKLMANKIIVPAALPLSIDLTCRCSIKNHYIFYHIKEDWYLMRDVVTQMYPNQTQSFDDFFNSTDTMYCCNMFIADKNTFSDYCAWLFPILSELEKVVKLSEYPYQRRIFGFFSERLLNFYLYQKKAELAEFPSLYLI